MNFDKYVFLCNYDHIFTIIALKSLSTEAINAATSVSVYVI